jgi:hypothetical protein
MPFSLYVDSIGVEYHSAQTLLMESLTSHRLSAEEEISQREVNFEANYL